jgi:murein DD-endopeptidase MepM/ murein hydrolase activator NlpD
MPSYCFKKNNNVLFPLLIILFFTISGFSFIKAATIDGLKQEITKRQTEIEMLEKQAAEYQSTINQRERTAKTLDEAIDALDGQINSLELKINITERQIEKTNLFIQSLKLKINEKLEEIDGSKKNMAGIMQTIYETDDGDALELIFKYENFSDFMNQVDYTDNLQKELQRRLDELKTLKIKLESEKGNMESEKENLADYQNDLNVQQNILASQRSEKNNLFLTTKKEEKRYKQLLTDVETKRLEIQKEIFELEDKLRYTIDSSQIPKPRSGVLEWPSKGYLTQKYGPTSSTGFINDAYSFHNGIDLAAGLGSPVRAAKDGIIKAVGDNGKYAYGKWVAIEHNNGLTTLYGHLSLIAVKKGESINQGAIIGYEGSTGFSTGSHLHFTVYATHTFMVQDRWFGLLPTGGHINPLDYL